MTSAVLPKKIKPVNRHLSVIPHFPEESDASGVLLPEDYERPMEKYITATVLDYAKDCNPAIRAISLRQSPPQEIVVDRAMIEEITICGKSYYVILENYVVGVLKSFSE